MTTYARPTTPAYAPPDGPTPRPPRRRRSPLWARTLIVAGVVIMLMSGGAIIAARLVPAWLAGGIKQEDLLPRQLRAAGNPIDGPINILLLGMDERAGTPDPIRADAIIVVHIPASHDAMYLVSIPRDTRVTIPPFPPAGYGGGPGKINAAFAIANEKGGKGDPSTAGRQRGVQLTAETINRLVPGGLRFNAVAIINYGGFRDVLTVLGGVDLCIDVRVVSEHYDRAGHYHTSTRAEGVPGYVYNPGCQHLRPWQALDYVRQREGVPGGDYARQRHQQQMLIALFRTVSSRGVLTDPAKVNQLRAAAGRLLTLDLGRAPLIDWILTLKAIGPDHIVMIKTNAGTFASLTIDQISYETLTRDSLALLRAVHDDEVSRFVQEHPSWVTRPR
jgi:polyisoprenyl-teichoic acid--peptidoglycan teichoic acid transferase